MPSVCCYSCGAQLQLPEGPVARSATCDSCMRDIRCCRNCLHYDTKAYNECREPSAERVVEKEKGNFCDYFRPRSDASSSAASDRDAVLRQLDDLFKK